MEFSSATILDSISNHLRKISEAQENAANIPIYWKERINSNIHINRLICFAAKDDLEKFMYAKWLRMGNGHMIARAMAEHVLFYEIDGVEFLLEANRSFAEKQKSLGQKHRGFQKPVI